MPASPSSKNYSEIVLTGGPSAGKSSSLAYLAEEFSEHGVRTLIRPEIATMIINGGVSDLVAISKNDPERFHEIERQMILLCVSMRQRWQQMAESFAPDPVVIIYDRAEMDNHTYLGEQRFKAIASEHNLTLTQLRDSYDAIIHLRTGAFVDAYDSDGNSARHEDSMQAKLIDEQTLLSWQGAPHLWVVEADKDFKAKRKQVFQIAAHSIGLKAPIEIERRFLLKQPPDLHHPVLDKATVIDIEQTYLKTDDQSEARIRKRSQDTQTTYFWTYKKKLSNGTREEREALIKPSEYLHLAADADPDRRPITKRRFCFVWENMHYELDCIDRPNAEPLWVLEVELIDLEQKLRIPDFLTVEKEVTDEERYSNAHLALSASHVS